MTDDAAVQPESLEPTAAAPLQYSHGDDDPATAATAATNAPLGRVDLAVILLRVLALVCLLLALPGFLFALLGPATLPWASVAAMLVPYVAFGSVGAGLWLSARRLGRWILGDVPPPDAPAATVVPAGGITAANLQSVLISVVGVATVASAVRHLSNAMYLYAKPARALDDFDASAAIGSDLESFALEAGVGVALFLGARGLSRLWQRARGDAAEGGATG